MNWKIDWLLYFFCSLNLSLLDQALFWKFASFPYAARTMKVRAANIFWLALKCHSIPAQCDFPFLC